MTPWVNRNPSIREFIRESYDGCPFADVDEELR